MFLRIFRPPYARRDTRVPEKMHVCGARKVSGHPHRLTEDVRRRPSGAEASATATPPNRLHCAPGSRGWRSCVAAAAPPGRGTASGKEGGPPSGESEEQKGDPQGGDVRDCYPNSSAHCASAGGRVADVRRSRRTGERDHLRQGGGSSLRGEDLHRKKRLKTERVAPKLGQPSHPQ